MVGGRDALTLLAPHDKVIRAANDFAVSRLQDARPKLLGIALAREAIPQMGPRVVLHAGPPIVWRDMGGPMRGAIRGACLFEGWASTINEADHLARSGGLEFAPCNEREAVGPMAGIVTPSMPVWVVENETEGNRAYATFNEGLGKVLRYGAYDKEVLARLEWMRTVLAPTISAVLQKLKDPIDLRGLMIEALEMGDELHNRTRAGTSLFLNSLIPGFIRADLPKSHAVDAVEFISTNAHFFLNLAMAAAKTMADAAAGIRGSSIVGTMSRNGQEFGIRLSGTGDRWFTGPSGTVKGVYYAGFGAADASPDLGDSTIAETVGLGGLAMAAAPGISQVVRSTTEDVVGSTRSMYEITCSESDHWRIPTLDFRGVPLGIDCRKVVETGILPQLNTGIAHREPGIGQVGAGLVNPPMNVFVDAANTLADSLSNELHSGVDPL